MLLISLHDQTNDFLLSTGNLRTGKCGAIQRCVGLAKCPESQKRLLAFHPTLQMPYLDSHDLTDSLVRYSEPYD